MIYFLDGNQEVIKIVRSSAVISAIQTQELPEDNSLLRDYLSVRLKNDERLFNAQYMAIKSHGGNRNAFDLYRIASEIVPDNATEFMGVQVAPYELEGVVIEDLRPQDRPLNQTMSQVLEGSDWRLGYVAGNLPNVTTNFYYTSVKDALKKIQELLNVEMLFKVEISGNKITDKWVEVYHQLGNRTMKRFNYGTNALSVVRESSHDELYTALIGRGKGEEVGETESGDATYGRKINFADVEWKKSAGKPVDKPKGQKYIELPNATAEYGIKLLDGRKVPRIGIVEFNDTDDPEKLIQETYQELLVRARPRVLFKASVINTGDMLIGDTVTIHRHDLGFHYQARVRKVVRDRKNNNKTQVEIGDIVHTPSTKRQGQINSALNNVSSDLENVRGEITEARSSADGKNTNFYGNAEPDRKKVGDTWFRDHPSLTGESQILVWNGEAWELIMDTSDTTKNADAIAEQQQEIEDARQTADEAVDSINIAVSNAGFTSLNDTLQNMNYITMNAEQSAQQAITDASNAYGLAQTSISEAQTAQSNSLTALGRADNALDGVSSLNVRVDDVEAELELKADNAFMNEDGTLTTLSNAITFNAHRFSSDMQRIESRVESLAGEINLVVLRDAFENSRIATWTTYPNTTASSTHDTMRDLIAVEPNENLVATKETVAIGSNSWHINFYNSSGGYVSGVHNATSNELDIVVPDSVVSMWVSYPKNSKPQIVRGTEVIPYRPNLADQMTTDEIVIFRNQYDEFADRTERRMTNIDGSGGRLEVAEALITQTADSLQTTVGKVDSQGSRLSTVEQTANGLQNSVYNSDGSSKITQLATAVNSVVSDFTEAEKGSENLLPKTNFEDGLLPSLDSYNVDLAIVDIENPHGQTSKVLRMNTLNDSHYLRFQDVTLDMDETYTFSMWVKRVSGGYYSGSYVGIGTDWETESFAVTGDSWTKVEVTGKPGKTFNFIQIRTNNQYVDLYIYRPKLEVGKRATRWSPGIKDIASQSQISQLADNINLRVTKGELLSQINIEADRTLIQSNKLLLNANNTVITGTAWMDGAVIANASIDGAKIQDATIGSAKIASLDVGKISGNTSNFVQSNWNSLSTSVSINSTGITISNSNNTIQAILRDGIIEFRDNTSNIVGGMAVAELIDQSTRYKGIITHANYDKFWAINKQWTAGGGYGPVIRTAIREPGLEIHVGTRIFGTLNMGGNEIHSVDRLYMGNTVEGLIRNPTENSIVAVAAGGIRLAVGSTGTSGYTTRLRVTNSSVRVDTDLEVTGYTVLNNTLNMSRKQIHGAERIYMGDTTNGLGVSGGRPFLDGSTGVYLSYGNNMRIDVLDTVIRFYGQLDMNGNTITGQSDYRLKRDIKATELNSLVAIESWKIVGFNWIDDEMNERNGRQLGVIAQDTPDLAMYDAETDTWSINSSKQIMMNSHAIQQLALREKSTNLVANQALEATESNESKIHKLQQELSKANRRIEELESVM